VCWEQYLYSSENRVELNRYCVTEVTRGGKILTGLPHAEYVADFELAVERALPLQRRKLFALHFREGLPFCRCLGRLGLDRGRFFHEVYRVEEEIGEQCLKGLYPLDEYFGVRQVVTIPSSSGAGGDAEVPRVHRPPLLAAA